MIKHFCPVVEVFFKGIAMIEREPVAQLEEEKEEAFISPLDRKDGRVPSWVEIRSEFNLDELPRGKKKLYHSFYRVQRMIALGKKKKGLRLMNALDKLPHFIDFEDRHGDILNLIAKRVRGKGV